MWGKTVLDDHRGKNSSHSNRSLGDQSPLRGSDYSAQQKQLRLFWEISTRHFSSSSQGRITGSMQRSPSSQGACSTAHHYREHAAQPIITGNMQRSLSSQGRHCREHAAEAPLSPASQEPETGQTWEPGCELSRMPIVTSRRQAQFLKGSTPSPIIAISWVQVFKI